MIRAQGQAPRPIGVLGGMGPAATLDFLAKLQRATPAARDQDHLRVLVDINPQVPDRNAALADDGPSPAPVLVAMAQGLEASGAQALAIACNSAHAFADDVRAAVRIPLLDMIEATAAATRARAPEARRVGVLAAAACLDAQLYPRAFAAAGVEALVLEGEDRHAFMGLLYRIKAGDRGEEVAQGLQAAAGTLIAQGAQAIVSGCTEVPLALRPQDLAVPLVDSTDALVARVLAFARSA